MLLWQGYRTARGLLVKPESSFPDGVSVGGVDVVGNTAAMAFLDIAASFVLAVSFVSIAVALIYFSRSRKDAWLRRMLLLGALLSMVIAIDHLVDSLVFWQYFSEFGAWLKVATALIAFSLIPLVWKFMPRALKLPNQVDMVIKTNELARTENELSAALVMLEEHVEERTRELQILSVTDPLTGAINRRGVMEQLEYEIQRCHRYSQDLSVLMIDLDNFKAVNDGCGHHIGDNVLVVATKCFKELSRSTDTVGRIGGEEFLIVLPGTSSEEAMHLGERLRAGVAMADVVVGGQAMHFTCSIGVAQLEAGDSMNALLRKADQALYEAKHLGKNRIALSCGG